MRNMLLATTAAIALLAGMTVASAQYGTDERQPPAATQGKGAEQPRQKAQEPGQIQRGAQEQGRPEQGKQGTRSSGERGVAPKGRATQDEPGGKAAQDKSAPDKGKAAQGTQDKGKAMRDQDQDRQAQPQRGQSERERTGQAPKGQRDERDQVQGQAPQRQEQPGKMGQPDKKMSQPDKKGQQPEQSQTGKMEKPAQDQQSSGSVTLNAEQRTKVQQTVLNGSNVPRVSSVNFSLRVGTVVPSRVRIVEVPTVLIDIHPEWRGYSYFVVRDDIIIVDRGHRIIAVMPVGGGSLAEYSVEEIRQIQLVLIEHGFVIDSPNGVLNAQTRRALVTFQRQQGLETSGRIDVKTVAALGLSDKVGKGRESYGMSPRGGKEPAAGGKEPAATGATPPANRESSPPSTGGAKSQNNERDNKAK
ncbi:MAG: DUF1236 domain-containing protein [Xanthobacteraceae bacterium]|nr:MAG: DUF1236 domain-containing protein [Xanthobacteraceae bacterium]